MFHELGPGVAQPAPSSSCRLHPLTVLVTFCPPMRTGAAADVAPSLLSPKGAIFPLTRVHSSDLLSFPPRSPRKWFGGRLSVAQRSATHEVLSCPWNASSLGPTPGI